MSITRTRLHSYLTVAAACIALASARVGFAQRVLGLDVSTYQGNISQTTWNNIHNVENRQFVQIRSSRGGTTGEDHRQGGYPSGDNTYYNLSERYDDPYFVQNITEATTAGMFAGPYHFARADVIASTTNSGGIPNNGTDEADHFMQMAGPWMRPGYLAPMYDFEAGQAQRTAEDIAQFSLDFSNRIYQVMGIRPSMYINGSYTGTLNSASQPLKDQLAMPTANGPSVVSPAYSTLWNARYAYQSPNYNSPEIQTANPKDTFSGFYGPWDDATHTNQPWAFWQYASTGRLNSFQNGTANLDFDISHGDIEYLKDFLIPAVWMNDNSGDWSTLSSWNSGQTPVQPPIMSGQLTPVATGPLPTPRLPGAAGSGPTSGQFDTVILERPNSNITVTLSSGTHNVRKLYMRETLNITGGSLTINYDPSYISDTVNYPNALRSGPISAEFSGAVTLSGSGSLNVNTLQVDAAQTFTLAGSSGALTFKTINLMPDSTTPAKIAMTGDVNISPLNNGTATIANGSGAGSSGFVDLGGATRNFNVGNGSSDVDLDVAMPIINGGLTKSGAGTMRLTGANTFVGAVTINAGVLRSNNAAGFSSSSVVTVNTGGTLDMNGVSDAIASLGGTSGGVVAQGAAGLTLAATSGSNAFAGTITGTGTLTKNGTATQILSGNNSLGAVSLSAGSLLFNGTNTTGAVTVNGGTLGGTGSVSGTVTVNSGGHVAPGASIGSLGLGSLTLNAGSALDIELGAPGVGDLLTVSGLLALNGGSVNLIDAGGLNAGTYTLVTYGSRTGSVANLGTPTGPSSFNYKLIESGNLINLLVSLPGDFNLDGTVDGADYVVWRKVGGTPADYDLWRANFGRSAGSGSGASFGSSASVPEPTAIVMLLCGMLPFIGRRSLRHVR
jgi:autotransporter-associated beta strand protein